MSWNWQYQSRAGEQASAAPPESGFPSQAEAETWVGEVWQDLLAAGVESVTLFEDGRKVYGPMSLHPLE